MKHLPDCALWAIVFLGGLALLLVGTLTELVGGRP